MTTGSRPEVELWTVDLAAQELDEPDVLSADERLRLGRITHAPARRAYLRGRVALRRILAGCLDCDPGTIVFRYGPNGKPALADDVSDLQFNVSHSGSLCLVAVTRQRAVGLDVEAVVARRDHRALARRFFTPAEQDLLETTQEPAKMFVRLWTLKEAAVKARGLKLLQGLDRFECLMADGVLSVMDRKSEEGELWSSRQWQCAPGFQAAIVVEGAGIEVIER